MGHGGGGRLSHQLIEQMIAPALKNPYLDGHDGAVLGPVDGKIAYTTDSYVVNPLFFPGGDIGKLAVYGTVNDLAMCGALPRYLSLGFIIEEGFSMNTLWKILVSIGIAARETGVQVVTGDTKVVDKNKGDGIYINTSGIGVVPHNLRIAPDQVKTGDKIIISGDIGRHGMCIMSQREGLSFESDISSDCAPLAGVTAELVQNVNVHCMRDLTRGGLVSALLEIAGVSKTYMEITEEHVPVNSNVAGACEILGLDPMHVANEGRFIVFVPPVDAQRTVQILQQHDIAQHARIIGTVANGTPGSAVACNAFGGRRILSMFSGEQLPRIC
ncbi:hydrogenase expression/formation protein HypE [candidate division KSB1 bacterium]|nr:hydrogenase expression/formation protein HypE [candidate division KSB1 bacterium]